MIDRIDHVVLTTNDLDACVHFYTNMLGMTLCTFDGGRQAFTFCANKPVYVRDPDRNLIEIAVYD